MSLGISMWSANFSSDISVELGYSYFELDCVIFLHFLPLWFVFSSIWACLQEKQKWHVRTGCICWHVTLSLLTLIVQGSLPGLDVFWTYVEESLHVSFIFCQESGILYIHTVFKWITLHVGALLQEVTSTQLSVVSLYSVYQLKTSAF